jgi:hypothetical protein
MKRSTTFLPGVAAVAAIAVGSVSTAQAAPLTLTGTVGPGFTISLKDGNGKPVKTLKAGRYTISVRDLASIHDFHLSGPGVDKAITTVGFVGTKGVTVTLKKGTYRYQCDPHATIMHGSFKVS